MLLLCVNRLCGQEYDTKGQKRQVRYLVLQALCAMLQKYGVRHSYAPAAENLAWEEEPEQQGAWSLILHG